MGATVDRRPFRETDDGDWLEDERRRDDRRRERQEEPDEYAQNPIEALTVDQEESIDALLKR